MAFAKSAKLATLKTAYTKWIERQMPLSNQNASGHIFILEDDVSLMNALTRLLKKAGYEVEGALLANDFLELLTKWDWSNPMMKSCAILDVNLPESTGIEVQKRMLESFSDLPVIFISGVADRQAIIDAWRNGAVDFLLKPFDVSDLLGCLDRVFLASEGSLSSEMQEDRCYNQLSLLTPRERQVLVLIAQGNTNVVISDMLGLSLRTVKMHRANLMQKLGYKHVVDLVRFHDACQVWL